MNPDYDALTQRGWTESMIANAQLTNSGHMTKAVGEVESIVGRQFDDTQRSVVETAIHDAHNLPLDDVAGKAKVLHA